MSKRPNTSSVYVISSDDEENAISSDDESAIQLIAYKKSKSSSPPPKKQKSLTSTPTSSKPLSTNNISTTTTTTNNNHTNNNNQLKFNGKQIYFNRMINDPPPPSSSKTSKTSSSIPNNSNHPIDNNNLISLAEILNISQAKSLFLSSYCLDFDFLKTIIPFTKCELPITLSKHWDQQSEKKGRTMLKIGTCPVCICHPPLLGAYSNMHAKLFMIEFDGFIRIVISSANLTEFDWNYFKQCIWIQDFPKKVMENESSNSSSSSHFENTLVEFWTKLTDGIPGNFLKRYDYSNAMGTIIPSIPGYHKSLEKDKFGHLAIKKSIERMNFTKSELDHLKNSPLYFQMSSIGSMNTDWIKELSQSFHVKDSNHFNIVFPSLETVSTSHFGLRCGGMIHLKSKTFQSSTFPKHLMTHYLPNQSNHLSHAKIVLHLSNLRNGFILVGSHNLSQPALGKLQKNESQLYVSNYEIGIILKMNQLNTIINKNDNNDNNDKKNDEKNEKEMDELVVNNENLLKYCKLNLPFKIPTKRMDKSDAPFILETVQDLLE